MLGDKRFKKTPLTGAPVDDPALLPGYGARKANDDRIRPGPCGVASAPNGEGSGVLRRTPHFGSFKKRFLDPNRNSTSLENALEHQPACKPGSVGHRPFARTIRDGHSSGTTLARCLEQPTRTASLTSPCGVIAFANSPRCRPYSVLLPVWFAMPVPLPEPRCALTAPFHPCPPKPRRAKAGGSFSVALSLGLPPPDVIRHRMSMEPGLSSPLSLSALAGAAVRPTDASRHGGSEGPRQAGKPLHRCLK